MQSETKLLKSFFSRSLKKKKTTSRKQKSAITPTLATASTDLASPVETKKSSGKFWATPTTLIQNGDQDLSDLVADLPKMGPDTRPGSPKVIHTVNLYPPRAGDCVQNRTTNSMIDAKRRRDDSIVLVNTQLGDDSDQTPDGFLRSGDILRTVDSVDKNLVGKPLPLLFDILDSAADLAAADDYLIFTNSDICVQPYFYDCVFELISYGFDSLVINRRTVGENYLAKPHSALLQAELGMKHPGFDCFVFRKANYDQFVKNTACIGVAGVAMGLLYNMVVHSSKTLILTDAALTYHFGDDQQWKDDHFANYTAHNQREYLSVLRHLAVNKKPFDILEQFVTNWKSPKPSQDLIAKLAPR